jgi:hypothetical protein
MGRMMMKNIFAAAADRGSLHRSAVMPAVRRFAVLFRQSFSFFVTRTRTDFSHRSRSFLSEAECFSEVHLRLCVHPSRFCRVAVGVQFVSAREIAALLRAYRARATITL